MHEQHWDQVREHLPHKPLGCEPALQQEQPSFYGGQQPLMMTTGHLGLRMQQMHQHLPTALQHANSPRVPVSALSDLSPDQAQWWNQAREAALNGKLDVRSPESVAWDASLQHALQRFRA